MKTYTNEDLRAMSENRHKENHEIKDIIIKEFKARFTKPGEGLDLYQYASNMVQGMLEETGSIGQLILRENGTIGAVLIQEYEDSVEDFEDQYFECDDWPFLLMNVREGIEDEWFVDEMFDEEDE